jgi:DNA modification methylase
MLEDAQLDLTNRSDIVIDPFLGSGSTLIAAERTWPRFSEVGGSNPPAPPGSPRKTTS